MLRWDAAHVTRRALKLRGQRSRMKYRLKRTYRKQVEKEGIKVALSKVCFANKSTFFHQSACH